MAKPNKHTSGKWRPKKEEVHPAVLWCRNIGLGSIFLGGFGVMSPPQYFWYAVALFDFGILLLVFDLWFEPTFNKYRSSQVFISLLLIAALISFNVYIGFASAPLEINAFSGDADHPPGKDSSGISWSPRFSELTAWIMNQTSHDYEDINVVLRPDQPVVAIGQNDGPPCRLEDSMNWMTNDAVDIDLGTGKRTTVPLILIASDGGYRVRCDKLPANDRIIIIMAIGRVRSETIPGTSIFDSNYWLKMPSAPLDNRATTVNHWFGHQIIDELYESKIIVANSVNIHGEYTAVQRRRKISQTVKTPNILDDILKSRRF